MAEDFRLDTSEPMTLNEKALSLMLVHAALLADVLGAALLELHHDAHSLMMDQEDCPICDAITRFNVRPWRKRDLLGMARNIMEEMLS